MKIINLFLITIVVSLNSAQGGLWPTFHNDAQRTGYAPRPGPSDETLLWSYTTGGGIRSSPAISEDSTVYIGSCDSNLYAINKSGIIKWNFITDGEVYSSPAIGSDGTIYFGSTDGYLYAVEDSVTYGKLRWKFAASDAIRGPVLIGAKRVLYFKAAGKFYAVNPDGTQKSVFTPEGGISGDVAGVTLSPDSTTLYFIAGSGSGPYSIAEVYSVDTSNVLNWKFYIGDIPFNYPLSVTPLVDANGTIFVPTLDAPFYAINPNGTMKWHTLFDVSTLRSTPALGPDGTIYVGSSSSLVAINSSDGSFKWSFPTPSGRYVWSSPAVDVAGVIYFSDRDNWNFYAVNPDGSLKWTFSPGGVNLFPNIAGSPAVGWDSTVIFGSASNNKVYVLGNETTGVGSSSFTVSSSKEGYLKVSPNPFSKLTTIKFQILPPSGRESSQSGTKAKSQIALRIYNTSGQLIKDFSLPTAYFLLPGEVSWSGLDNTGKKLPAGVYFVRFDCGNLEKVKKAILLK